MVKDAVIIGLNPNKPSYVNGKIVKVREESVYDVQLSTGQVEAYIENVSNVSYNSGDYVAILIIGTAETRSCKIIGKGRKITDPSSIKTVVV